MNDLLNSEAHDKQKNKHTKREKSLELFVNVFFTIVLSF
jgi:hypothetical protein